MKQTSAFLIFSLCVASCLAVRQLRTKSSLGVTSNFSSSKLPMMLNIPQYKRDCWQKRPVYSSLLQGSKNPGAGLEPFTPYDLVLKDGFMPIDCVKDKLFLHGDKFGDGKFSYNLENVSNVSIVHYTEVVPKEDRKPMTQKVCFEFCRTVPEMGFFGIFMGRDCYCAPFYKMVADDSSQCDQLCEGDSTLVCGGKSKSSIFSMHMCSSTAKDLKKSEIEANKMVGDLKSRIAVANGLSGNMQKAAELNQKIFGQAGDPASSDLMQDAKVFAGVLAETAVDAGRISDDLFTLVSKSRDLEKKDSFEKSDIVTAAERIMEKVVEDEEEADKRITALGKVIKLAHPGHEELGSAMQYYPMMYFVDKKYTETMTTCKGPMVDKPIVGESIDGCASACDAEIHNCVGFMYYGTGDTSLCYLYSGFKSAMYWTGCNKPPKKEFLQIEHRSGPIITPWGCGDVSSAWQSQSLGNDPNVVTTIQMLNITSGAYDLVFTLPNSLTDPPFRNINSCAINPQDDILYCSMQINNKGSFLMRIDGKGQAVAYVAKLPSWQYAGIFDKDGNYYCGGDKSWSVLTGVTGKPSLASWSQLGGEEFVQDFNNPNIGADFASFTEDLEGTGSPQTYIVAAQDSTVTLIRVNPTPYVVTKLTEVTGLPSGKTWASAWSFKSTIFFAAEDGSGIVQLEMNSIHLNNKSCSFSAAGKSDVLEWNDGFSCPNAVGGILPTQPPQPRPWTTKPTTTTTVTTEGPEMDIPKKPTTTTQAMAPPAVGQVKCMAKLSKFEGTTLKPDPSGKCKQCLRKLVDAQRCYE